LTRFPTGCNANASPESSNLIAGLTEPKEERVFDF
jgi:hypothetical protein